MAALPTGHIKFSLESLSYAFIPLLSRAAFSVIWERRSRRRFYPLHFPACCAIYSSCHYAHRDERENNDHASAREDGPLAGSLSAGRRLVRPGAAVETRPVRPPLPGPRARALRREFGWYRGRKNRPFVPLSGTEGFFFFTRLFRACLKIVKAPNSGSFSANYQTSPRERT